MDFGPSKQVLLRPQKRVGVLVIAGNAGSSLSRSMLRVELTPFFLHESNGPPEARDYVWPGNKLKPRDVLKSISSIFPCWF